MKAKIIKLKNNGTLIYEKNNLNNSSAVEVGFFAGSYTENKRGTAHFLEHTLFKKTRNRDNLTIENDRNTIVFINAMTSMDYLMLRFYRSNKLIKESMEFSEDILINSILDDEYLETEKGVITEELNIFLDNESRDIYDKMLRQCQSNVMFSSDVVGSTEENIKSITFKDLIDFKNDYFNGNNFVISVASALPLRKIKSLVNRYFVPYIPYNPSAPKPKNNYKNCVVDKEPSLKIYENTQDKISMLISIKINRTMEQLRDNHNFVFLAKHFSGEQGDLFLTLRNKGLIYRLNSEYSCFYNDSLFNISVESSKEKIKEIVEIIKDYIKKILTEEVSEQIIELYKKNIDYFDDEKIPMKMQQICHNNLIDFLYTGKIEHITKKMKKKIRDSVSSDGMQSVAKEIFNKNNNIYVAVMGNISEEYVQPFDYFKENFLIYGGK